jgi:hypothetical protein
MLKTVTFVVILVCVACGRSPSAPESPPGSVGAEAPAANDAAEHEAMRVSAPRRDAIALSPLVVTGEARGTWYFEATFPLALLDAQGNTLANGYAQAEGEWMTEDFVPFRAELTFTAPAAATETAGTLVLQKANPSDLPEHAAEVRVPVRLPAPQP